MTQAPTTGSEPDRAFAGSIPQLYQQWIVPLIFEPYAADLARRTAALQPARVLELAAGTGVVTRALAQRLDPGAELVATDLNQPMLDHAAALPIARPVRWQQADAMRLPFADASFDAVVCQFASCSSATRQPPGPKRGGCCGRAARCCSTPGTASSRTNSPTR